MVDAPTEWLKHAPRRLYDRSNKQDGDNFIISVLRYPGWDGMARPEKQVVVVVFGSDATKQSEKWKFTGWATIRSRGPNAITYNVPDCGRNGPIEIKLIRLIDSNGKFRADWATQWYKDHIDHRRVPDFDDAVAAARVYSNVIPFSDSVNLAWKNYPVGFIDSRCCDFYNIKQSFEVSTGRLSGSDEPYLIPKLIQSKGSKRHASEDKSASKRHASKRRIEDLNSAPKSEVEKAIKNTKSASDAESIIQRMTVRNQAPPEDLSAMFGGPDVHSVDDLPTTIKTPISVQDDDDVQEEAPRVELEISIPSVVPQPDVTPVCSTPPTTLKVPETVCSYYIPIVQRVVRANAHVELVRAFPGLYDIVESMWSENIDSKDVLKSLRATNSSSDWRDLFIWIYVDFLLFRKFPTNMRLDQAAVELALNPVCKKLTDYDYNILIALVAGNQRTWKLDNHVIKFNDYNSELPLRPTSQETEAFIFFVLCHVADVDVSTVPKAILPTESLYEYSIRIA